MAKTYKQRTTLTMTKIDKISAVMCTFKRFKCVQRALDCFVAQSYPNKELIIFNTDTESPYELTLELMDAGVKIINQSIDEVTNLPYTNVGAIRRDALQHATGDYVITWDDDDIWLDFFMQQAIDRMKETGLPSFKPEKSFFYAGDNLRLVKNTLEASVVADIQKVREYGYHLETGKEGLAWYTKMRDNRELTEHDSHCIPAYCFCWQDSQNMLAPHKQSGDINNPDNFENHKQQSIDPVDGRHLKVTSPDFTKDVTLWEYYFFLHENMHQYPKELFTKYLLPQ